MFNSSYYHAGNHTNNFKINAVSGAILKNHPKSWFERFHLKSEKAKNLFTEGGHRATTERYVGSGAYGRDRYVHDPDPDKNITILQMVICGDMEVLAELVYTKDYEIKPDSE